MMLRRGCSIYGRPDLHIAVYERHNGADIPQLPNLVSYRPGLLSRASRLTHGVGSKVYWGRDMMTATRKLITLSFIASNSTQIPVADFATSAFMGRPCLGAEFAWLL